MSIYIQQLEDIHAYQTPSQDYTGYTLPLAPISPFVIVSDLNSYAFNRGTAVALGKAMLHKY